HALCEAIVSVAYGEIPPGELTWAAHQAKTAAAAAQERGFEAVRTWITRSLGPGARACRQLLTCLDQSAQDLAIDEVMERAKALSRDDAFRPSAEHCAYQICNALGYPKGGWGLSQKIFKPNFDLHQQIDWINRQL